MTDIMENEEILPLTVPGLPLSDPITTAFLLKSTVAGNSVAEIFQK